MGTPRSTMKTRDYFQTVADQFSADAEEHERIAARKDITGQHRGQLLFASFLRRLQALTARYSLGASRQELASSYPALVESAKRMSEHQASPPFTLGTLEDYLHALWLVSLGILLDDSRQHLERAAQIIDQRGKDRLLDRLLEKSLGRPVVASTLLFANVYRDLYAAIDANQHRRPGLLMQFLSDYYENMSETYWYDSHFRDDAGFVGYWSFECAAVVKAFGIDDRSIRGSAYYPQDLAHPGTD